VLPAPTAANDDNSEDLTERRRIETTVSTLMGKKPELRFAFIQENAQFVNELDI